MAFHDQRSSNLPRRQRAIARSGDSGTKCDRVNTAVPVPAAYDSLSFDTAISLLVEHLNLTPRQAEVLHWIAEGKTNEEIGIILECSFFTVKAHVKEIFQRLSVHSRTAAAACAYRVHLAEEMRLRALLRIPQTPLS